MVVEELHDFRGRDVLVDISADDHQVADVGACLKFRTKVFEKGGAGVTIIILGKEMMPVLGEHSDLTLGAVVWAVEGIHSKEAAVCSAVSCPAPTPEVRWVDA